MALIKDKQVIARSKGVTTGAKQVKSAMSALRVVLEPAREPALLPLQLGQVASVQDPATLVVVERLLRAHLLPDRVGHGGQPNGQTGKDLQSQVPALVGLDQNRRNLGN